MPQSESIPLEGVLNCWNDDHDLPDLLVFVSRTGKSGRLRFSNPEGDKTLYLREGKFTFAQSSSPDDGLGQYLLRTGKVSLVDYSRVSKMVRPGKRLGSLLVKETVLEATDLAPAVVTQVREIILSLFLRTETWYKFEELPLASKEKITLNLPVSDLILEGVLRVDSWRRVSKGVGQLEDLYQVTGRHTSQWKHGRRIEGVQELLGMLAKPTSLADICTRSTRRDFETCQYIWGLRVLDWIQRVNQKDTVVDLSKTQIDAIVNPGSPRIADMPTEPAVSADAVRAKTPIPESLMKTQVAVDASRATKPPKRDDASTQIAVEPPAKATPERDDSATQIAVDPPAKATPGRDDAATQIAVDPPAKATPGRDDAATQIAVDPPAKATPGRDDAATQIAIERPGGTTPSDDARTQMLDTPPQTRVPRSTGEMMESILEDEEDTPRPAAQPSDYSDPAKTRIFEESSAGKAKVGPAAPPEITRPSIARKADKKGAAKNEDDFGLEHILEDEESP